MVRPRTIDREQLLDAAETLLAGAGATGLTFGALAEAAGVSKSSVQSVFGTREALIEAISARWLAGEQREFEAAAGSAPSPQRRLQAHLRTTAAGSVEAHRRLAVLFAALASAGQSAQSTRDWYQRRMGDLSASTPDERRRRLAFLAAEGAYFVRHLAGVPMDDALWQDIFDDLQALAATGGDA